MTTDAEQAREAAAIPDALWPFIQHNKDCVLLGHWMEAADNDCDCGLAEVLSAIPLPASTVAEQVRELAAKVAEEWDEMSPHNSRAAAIRAMPLPASTSTDNERLLRELGRDARDSRFSDELIGNRFRAALSTTGAKP